MMATEGVVHVTLRGAGGDYRIPAPFWVALTGLAVERGWQPRLAALAGTPAAECELILAQVTDEDARALAEAPERAARCG